MPSCVLGGRYHGHRPAAAARGGGFTACRGLIAVASAVPMAEAAVAGAVAPTARTLAPQVTALGPLAVFHDLRWLFAYGGAWPWFPAAPAPARGVRPPPDPAPGWLAAARARSPPP